MSFCTVTGQSTHYTCRCRFISVITVTDQSTRYTCNSMAVGTLNFAPCSQIADRTRSVPEQLKHLVKKLLIIIGRVARLLEIKVSSATREGKLTCVAEEESHRVLQYKPVGRML